VPVLTVLSDDDRPAAERDTRPRLVLGIESSCDETGAAVVGDDGFVWSDVVQSQVSLHAPFGGVVPELASRDHLVNLTPVVREALGRAKVTLDDVSAIAVTNRPGLVGALFIGVQAAKGLAWAAGKPLYGVDHLVGHLLSVFLRRPDDVSTGAVQMPPPPFPFVCLLASGGHTAIYRVDGSLPSEIRELGATRDDAAGEAFDKVARVLGLGYPGGPRIEALAAQGDSAGVRLPRPMQGPMLEFSFSGLKTAVAARVATDGIPRGQALADLCASFQDVVCGTLADKLIRAATQEGVLHVVLGGGVAANRELRARVTRMAEARGLFPHVPTMASCTDNAAMIAYAGAKRSALEPGDGWDLVATSTSVLPRRTRKGGGRR
jgi:N6-L-threonylcarbamoyladenine synthase